MHICCLSPLYIIYIKPWDRGVPHPGFFALSFTEDGVITGNEFGLTQSPVIQSCANWQNSSLLRIGIMWLLHRRILSCKKLQKEITTVIFSFMLFFWNLTQRFPGGFRSILYDFDVTFWKIIATTTITALWVTLQTKKFLHTSRGALSLPQTLNPVMLAALSNFMAISLPSTVSDPINSWLQRKSS